MLRRIVLVLGFLLVSSCMGEGREPYLAPGTWPDDRTEQYEKWYGKQLAAMREPSLAGGSETTAVRMLFLPSSDTPKMVRLTFTPDGHVRLAYKTTTWTGNHEPGLLASNETGTVPADTAARVLASIDRMGVWSGRVPLEKQDRNGFCFDGTQVFLEFARPGTWVPVNRHDCEMAADDPLRLLVKEMGALAGHPFNPMYFR